MNFPHNAKVRFESQKWIGITDGTSNGLVRVRFEGDGTLELIEPKFLRMLVPSVEVA